MISEQKKITKLIISLFYNNLVNTAKATTRLKKSGDGENKTYPVELKNIKHLNGYLM